MASDDCDCSSCIDDRHESSQIIEKDTIEKDTEGRRGGGYVLVNRIWR
jgi:hypothetical protein